MLSKTAYSGKLYLLLITILCFGNGSAVAKKDVLRIMDGKIYFNNKQLTLPAPAEDWVAIFGKPDRKILTSERYHIETYVWDRLGIRCNKCSWPTKPARHLVNSFSVQLRINSKREMLPWEARDIFKGRLFLEGVEVTNKISYFDYKRVVKKKRRLYGFPPWYKVCKPHEVSITIGGLFEDKSRDHDNYGKISSISVHDHTNEFKQPDEKPCEENPDIPSAKDAFFKELFPNLGDCSEPHCEEKLKKLIDKATEPFLKQLD